ncbi:fimbrial protein [Pseudomonas protegens]|uniref:fimbrial protein n=1 Tax=Pseudomonas protegens TaxID=380021 RepID=UPI00218906F0|nr:MAG: type 1 fimbrial protein [Pseudomonas protegens]WEK25790.1 MAG: fimbrial protein [Pseudomonas protegens]
MKPYARCLSWLGYLLVLSGFALITLPAAATENLFFSGALVAEPCTLMPEDREKAAPHLVATDKELYRSGRTRGEPIVLRLLNCDVGQEEVQIKILFDGASSSADPAYLKPASGEGMAEGVLIGLETQDGQLLPLHQSNPMGRLSNGDNQISFMAYLKAEAGALVARSIKGGNILATLSFILSYD